MLHHRTDDIAQRAADVAEKEANQIYTGSYEQWFSVWKKTYEQTLKEFTGYTGGELCQP